MNTSSGIGREGSNLFFKRSTAFLIKSDTFLSSASTRSPAVLHFLLFTRSFTLEPTTEGTKFMFEMEYELPYSVIGKIFNKLKVQKEMEEDVYEGLKNLKFILEK